MHIPVSDLTYRWLRTYCAVRGLKLTAAVREAFAEVERGPARPWFGSLQFPFIDPGSGPGRSMCMFISDLAGLPPEDAEERILAYLAR